MGHDRLPDITIAGAGLTGCFAAILLARRGFKVEVYENYSRGEIRNAVSDRSFSLTFNNFGEQAFKQAGLWDAVRPIIFFIGGTKTWMERQGNIEPAFKPYGKNFPCYGVMRPQLQEALIQAAAAHRNIIFHFNTAILYVNRGNKTALVRDSASGKISEIRCGVILGADGAHSRIRNFIQQGQDAGLRQEYCGWTYKQVALSERSIRQLGIEAGVSYTWIGRQAVFLTFAGTENRVSSMMLLPHRQGKGFAGLTDLAAVQELVKENLPALLPALQDIASSLQTNPEGRFVEVDVSPWYYRDFMVLMGDAAHGFWPFLGQGMSAGFGDALVLAGLIDKHGPDWQKIFPLYQQARKEHADALANLSKEALSLYLRQSRADYRTIYGKLSEFLYRLFPGLFCPPLHESAALDPLRAADHLRRYNRQRKILNFFGLPLLAYALTAVIWVWEFIFKIKDKI